MITMVFTMPKLYSHDLLAENRRLARANSSRPSSIKSWQVPHCYSLLTLIFYGYYPLYVYEFLVSLRIGMVKLQSVIRSQITVFTLLHWLFQLLYAHLCTSCAMLSLDIARYTFNVAFTIRLIDKRNISVK